MVKSAIVIVDVGVLVPFIAVVLILSLVIAVANPLEPDAVILTRLLIIHPTFGFPVIPVKSQVKVFELPQSTETVPLGVSVPEK